MGGGVVEPCFFELVHAHAGAVLDAGGVGGAQSEVAGGVFVEQGIVEQDIHIGNGGVVGNEGDLTQVVGAFAGFDEVFEGFFAGFGLVAYDLAVFKGQREVVDELAVIDEWMGADQGAVDLVLMRGGEHFLGWDIGEEFDAVCGFFAAAGPDMVFGHADFNVGTQAVFIDEFDKLAVVEEAGFILKAFIELVPGGNGVILVGPGGFEDRLPEHIDSGFGFDAGEYLGGPADCRHGDHAPAALIIHHGHVVGFGGTLDSG